MSGSDTGGPFVELYVNRLGEPTTDDEIRGYWLFVAGVLLGIVGLALFVLTEAATVMRGLGYGLAALSLPFILLGAVIRFPLRQGATYLGYFGAIVSFAAVVWFVAIFPEGWSLPDGNLTVITLYSVGLLLLGLSGAIVPLITDPIRNEFEQLREMSTEQAEEFEETVAELHKTESELEAARSELQEMETELETAHDELTETRQDLDEAEQELASIRSSQARFELYTDRGGGHRWRLRHRNGNIIATSGEAYSSRQKCQQGMHSVVRNAFGAGVLRIEDADEAETDAEEPEPADAEEPTTAVPSVDETAASNATFEYYEDAGGEYRWRLRHDNGNIIADSGEGYATKSNLSRALDRIREHVAAADYLRIDPTAFEIYRDRAGEYRWRLLHENGNILAISGQGYTSRSNARNGIKSLQRGVDEDDDSAAFEIYEDDAGEYRWRLRHRNGNIIATPGEGYTRKESCEDSIAGLREYAPDADVLDIEQAAFEIYEDDAGEYRWRLRHRNGNIVADSGEGYASRSSAERAIGSVKRNVPGADETEVRTDESG